VSSESLRRAKITFYRELLKVSPESMSDGEVELIYILSKERDLQIELQKVLSRKMIGREIVMTLLEKHPTPWSVEASEKEGKGTCRLSLGCDRRGALG